MSQDKLIVSQAQSNKIIEENTNQIYLKAISKYELYIKNKSDQGSRLK